MTAITAFRTFFVSRSKERAQPSAEGGVQWYTRSKRAFWRLIGPWSWRTKSTSKISAESNRQKFIELPHPPRATIKGVRTFINGQGKSTVADSQLMQSAVRVEIEDTWPLSEEGQDPYAIKMQHDVLYTSESVGETLSSSIRAQKPNFILDTRN